MLSYTPLLTRSSNKYLLFNSSGTFSVTALNQQEIISGRRKFLIVATVEPLRSRESCSAALSIGTFPCKKVTNCVSNRFLSFVQFQSLIFETRNYSCTIKLPWKHGQWISHQYCIGWTSKSTKNGPYLSRTIDCLPKQHSTQHLQQRREEQHDSIQPLLLKMSLILYQDHLVNNEIPYLKSCLLLQIVYNFHFLLCLWPHCHVSHHTISYHMIRTWRRAGRTRPLPRKTTKRTSMAHLDLVIFLAAASTVRSYIWVLTIELGTM